MKKILTVEDDKEINSLICEYLSLQGYETPFAKLKDMLPCEQFLMFHKLCKA